MGRGVIEAEPVGTADGGDGQLDRVAGHEPVPEVLPEIEPPEKVPLKAEQPADASAALLVPIRSADATAPTTV